MSKSLLRDLIREALDRDSLIEALAEEIAGSIDYGEIASGLMDGFEDEIHDLVQNEAAELIGLYPF